MKVFKVACLVVGMFIGSVVAKSTLAADLSVTKAELACTWQTIDMARKGDWSQWVLPDFVPGPHKRAGEWADCMPRPVTPWGK